jgi:hypothetical protein
MGDHFRPGSTGITCPLCPKSKRCRLCQTWECFHHNPASAASSGAIRDRECQGRTAPALIRCGAQPALGTALPSSLYGGERICANNSPDWRLVPQNTMMPTQVTTSQTRLLLFAQTNNSIPMPFLVVLIFWLTIIFGSFGLFAKPSATVFGSLFVFALSAAGAIYLVLELGQPFAGLMQISSAPLRNALTPLSP